MVLAVGEHLFGKIEPGLRRASTGFGGGMGSTGQEACGALTGAVIVIGLIAGREDVEKDQKPCQTQVATLRERFQAEFGAIRCTDLSALGYGAKDGTPCSTLVERTANLLLELLDEHKPVQFRPIGRIANDFTDRTAPDAIRAAESRIVVNRELIDGLTGLEPGMNVMVVYHFHQARGGGLLQHRHNDPSEPERGVFSLHSPDRPNPIGVTVAEIVSRSENVLYVRGLDTINGTPVLDLKKA